MHPWKRFSLYAKSIGPDPRWLRARAAAGKSVEAIDDAAVTAGVRAALAAEPTLRASVIEVDTVGGDVRLRGRVADRGSIDKAGEIAGRVKGVKSVGNELGIG